jgi:hypothetical protein
VQAEQHFFRERNRIPVFALGYASMAFMRAMMTFGKAEIEEAEARVRHALVSTALPCGTAATCRLTGSCVCACACACACLSGPLCEVCAKRVLLLQHRTICTVLRLGCVCRHVHAAEGVHVVSSLALSRCSSAARSRR